MLCSAIQGCQGHGYFLSNAVDIDIEPIPRVDFPRSLSSPVLPHDDVYKDDVLLYLDMYKFIVGHL